MNCPFSEKYLQIIWNERMLTPRMHCLDGRPLQVLFPGVWNRGAGPDFSDAVLLLGGTPVRGQVELHRSPSEWFSHGHHRDSRYSGVVLHAVWSAAPDERLPPGATLLMEPHLLQGWREVLSAVSDCCYSRAREIPPGACFMRWALTDDRAMMDILNASGWSRLCRRGQDILAGCAAKGEDQALYELTFEGLGYASNRSQFRNFAVETPLEMLAGHRLENLPGILFGRGGLLPDCTMGEVICPEMRQSVDDAWHLCWAGGISPLAVPWLLNGGRPLNSVFRRMAAGAFWLQRCALRPARWLSEALSNAGNGRELLEMLLSGGSPASEMPWAGCRDFATRLKAPAQLLGRERLCELAINIWLPFLGAKADAEGNCRALEIVREAWLNVPRTQENHLLKEAVHRFLTPPSRSRQLLRRAAQQQGMMDIYRNFCLALQHSCNECPFLART